MSGIIQESTSPWSSPIVAVPKLDSGFAMTSENLTKSQSSTATPCLKWMTSLSAWGEPATLDLMKSFWQVALTPTTASTTGHWQYWVLPFSLHEAPATFQHLMNILL